MDTVDMIEAYVWELEFVDRTKLTKTEWLKLPKEGRLDPNNPGRPVKYVRLIPQREGLLPVQVTIPANALPVAVSEQHRANGTALIGIVYKIGFNKDRIRHMICVSLPDKLVFQSFDACGCR